MKKYFSFFRTLSFISLFLFFAGCVHDDKYDTPADATSYQCADLTATMTIAQVKALYTASSPLKTYVFPSDSNAILEGYVSSTDETGNIYKTIYIQDSPSNPTQGFTISVNAVNTYTNFPQGSKIYIKLNGLAVGAYGGLVQLGSKDLSSTATTTSVDRIAEADVPSHIFKSCTIRANIVPKVMTLAQMGTATDQFIGCLIQVNDAEFDSKVLCSNYAPPSLSVDRQINDPTTSVTTRVVRNSGYASFANQKLPSGKGKFIGILSKYSSSYQLFINKVNDLSDMIHYPRKDGLTTNPCILDESTQTVKTIAEIKQLYTGTMSQITGNYMIKAKVTANDQTGNLYKYIYVEDATGGIKININKLNLYQDARFRVGALLYVKLKDLYVGASGGEIQLGVPFSGAIGQIAEVDVYKYFFDSNTPLTNVVPTEKTINQFTTADVGKWVKIKNLEFISSDLDKTYADGASGATNRTLEDCSGNKIILRTNALADFGDADHPMLANKTTIDSGKGDLYAILVIFNGVYELYITNLLGADLDGVRCDGTTYINSKTIFSDDFSGSLATNWSPVSVTGSQVWATSNTGTGSNYYAVMNGYVSPTYFANEDWLVSKEIDLTGYTKINLSFDSDGRYTGNTLQAFITENYTGNPSTTTWTNLNATFDTTLTAFGFVNSGAVSLNAYANKKVRIAYKYTSTTTASTTWELDNVKVNGRP